MRKWALGLLKHAQRPTPAAVLGYRCMLSLQGISKQLRPSSRREGPGRDRNEANGCQELSDGLQVVEDTCYEISGC